MARDQAETQTAEKPGEERAGGGGVRGVPRSESMFNLSECLDRTNRHPVLLFGVAAAGKSSLILSIIRALRQAPEVNVELGDPVLDDTDPKRESAHKIAKSFFERATFDYDKGKPLESTQDKQLIIPIDIRPRDSRLPAVKIAFIDGRGEFYQPQYHGAATNDASNGYVDLYYKLDGYVASVLRYYSSGVSIIYAAPYLVSAGSTSTVDSDHGLVGVMEGYGQLRRNRENDFHLFLLTKWDEFASPADANRVFDIVAPGGVERVLSDRYPQSWGSFQGLPLEGPAADRRAFMQFSSGFYVDGVPCRPPKSYRDSFERYPRTVANWLYGNATRVRLMDDEKSIAIRKILFEDVTPPEEPRINISDRLAALLASK